MAEGAWEMQPGSGPLKIHISLSHLQRIQGKKIMVEKALKLDPSFNTY